MTTDRLIEPLGLLHGDAAREACAAGLALPLAGGPVAFSLCALVEGQHRRIVPTREIPVGWAAEQARVTTAPPMAGLPAGVLVMGILNVTPDSFSDGGRFDTEAAAITAADRMHQQGAGLIDIGGESTRPGAVPVSAQQEQARVLPVLRALVERGRAVSVDTRHAATMRAALGAGAALINDVSALAHDAEARAVIAEAGCPVVLMHMRGTPQTMAGLTDYRDVAVDVVRELGGRIDEAVAAGIARTRIIVDPGIGFAKTHEQNLELLRRLPILANLGCRVLLGVSRKGFIGRFGGESVATDRLGGSIAAALPGLVFAGSILRVHDVAETVQAVRLWQAVHG
ncbi:dihydropteroate synthase [Lichenicola sp.]|uniref:dihydropteroate synthase n=1 Tax=Lichenicola sp. TaxID=2804529 RepID=UPI003AFFEA3E